MQVMYAMLLYSMQVMLQMFHPSGQHYILSVKSTTHQCCKLECGGCGCRFDCLNTVMALSHSRDACLAPGGKFVVLFESGKQESELEQLRKEERLVKVFATMHTYRSVHHAYA